MSDLPKPVNEVVIGAEPGWTVVAPIQDEAGKSPATLWRTPVIAWLLQLFHRSTDETTFVAVTPITVNGDVQDVQDYALQRGDEPSFYTVHEEFTDEAALLAHFSARAARS